MAILLVDSETHVLDLLGHLCQELDVPHDKAYNRKQALEICSNKSVSLVITDVNLPADDGLILARELRERFPELPIYCFTSGSAHEWDELNAAFDEVFFKPSDYSRMIGEVLKRLAQMKYSL